MPARHARFRTLRAGLSTGRLLFVVALLASCGGGGDNYSPTAPATSPPPAVYPSLVGTYSSATAWSWTRDVGGPSEEQHTCAGSLTVTSQNERLFAGTYLASGCPRESGTFEGSIGTQNVLRLTFTGSGSPFGKFGCRSTPLIIPSANRLDGWIAGEELSLSARTSGFCDGYVTMQFAASFRGFRSPS